MKKFDILLSAVAVAYILLSAYFFARIPPRDMTVTRMGILKRRVLQYTQAHGELPKSLAALPAMEGHDISIQDGWQRDIIFEISDPDVMSFRSLGRDGLAGGSGEDADIIRSFPAHDASGRKEDAEEHR